MRRPKSRETNSTSGVEWLTHPCLFEHAAIGKDESGPRSTKVNSRGAPLRPKVAHKVRIHE
eukprot:7415209-Lingulodinium_polyedra.AAC.1